MNMLCKMGFILLLVTLVSIRFQFINNIDGGGPKKYSLPSVVHLFNPALHVGPLLLHSQLLLEQSVAQGSRGELHQSHQL